MNLNARGPCFWAILLDGIKLTVLAKEPLMLCNESIPLFFRQTRSSFALQVRDDFRVTLNPTEFLFGRRKISQL